MNLNSKIFLSGHRGMVGSSILRKLQEKGYKNIITTEKKEINLLNQTKIFKFLKKRKPDYVIIAAAKVGGILSNLKFKAEYIYQNTVIQSNLIHGSYLAGVKNLLLLEVPKFFAISFFQPKKTRGIS